MMNALPEPPRREGVGHYARPGHVSFVGRSFQLTILAVESSGRLGEEGFEIVHELATDAKKERYRILFAERSSTRASTVFFFVNTHWWPF